MSVLSIVLDRPDGHYRPLETLRGAAGWQLASQPEMLELRLFWFTAGKGTPDIELIETRRFANPSQQGRELFEFSLPRGPYSFSGSLISLKWAVELVANEGEDADRCEFSLSPGNGPIELEKVASDRKGFQFRVGA